MFTIGGWIHAISGMIAAISVMVAILLLTTRLVRSGRLSGWYRSLALWAVLGPASYVLMLATQPATFPAGLYQRLFIVCTWLWLVVTCAGLISGSLTGGIADREARTT